MFNPHAFLQFWNRVTSKLTPLFFHQVRYIQLDRIGCWKPHNPQTVGEIIEYLVFSSSPPGIDNLIGLPWFRNCSGSPVSLRPFGDRKRRRSLFLLLKRNLDFFSDTSRLRSVLLNPWSSRILSVVAIDIKGNTQTVFSMTWC